jgi:hypothetical protein
MGHNNTIPNGHPDKERVSNTPKKHPGGGYAEKCFGGTVAERKRCGSENNTTHVAERCCGKGCTGSC